MMSVQLKMVVKHFMLSEGLTAREAIKLVKGWKND